MSDTMEYTEEQYTCTGDVDKIKVEVVRVDHAVVEFAACETVSFTIRGQLESLVIKEADHVLKIRNTDEEFLIRTKKKVVESLIIRVPMEYSGAVRFAGAAINLDISPELPKVLRKVKVSGASIHVNLKNIMSHFVFEGANARIQGEKICGQCEMDGANNDMNVSLEPNRILKLAVSGMNTKVNVYDHAGKGYDVQMNGLNSKLFDQGTSKGTLGGLSKHRKGDDETCLVAEIDGMNQEIAFN